MSAGEAKEDGGLERSGKEQQIIDDLPNRRSRDSERYPRYTLAREEQVKLNGCPPVPGYFQLMEVFHQHLPVLLHHRACLESGPSSNR